LRTTCIHPFLGIHYGGSSKTGRFTFCVRRTRSIAFAMRNRSSVFETSYLQSPLGVSTPSRRFNREAAQRGPDPKFLQMQV
jgi:hypothetical protein